MKPVAFAIGAHPDDIEFRKAGTLLLLKQAGWEIHYLNIANGCCGSTRQNAARLRKMRAAEGRRAAKILGAHFHPSFCNDMEIVYDLKSVRRLAAIIREVKPSIILTHPPADYMEDHTNTCRLVVTAAFTREMPNFRVTPARRPYSGDVAIYHCVPHGLVDPLRRPMPPEFFVNTTSVHAVKQAALSEHRSQFDWLESSQGVASITQALDDSSRAVGKMSGRFQHAEGWWRHLHLGFSAEDRDPLREVLGPLMQMATQPRLENFTGETPGETGGTPAPLQRRRKSNHRSK